MGIKALGADNVKKQLTIVFILLIGIVLVGCNVNTQEDYQDKVVVLMYHHLDPKEDSSSTISPEKFAEHMAMLAEEGFNILSLDQLGAFLSGEGDLPDKAVVITFDDGYRSNYEYAFPVLKQYDFPATIFMIVSRIGREEGEIPKLTWEQMLEMQGQGIRFQSHSYDGHFQIPVNRKGTEKPVLAAEIYDEKTGTKEEPGQREQRVYDDLKSSKELLEREIGETVEYFAAPYGWYDDITIRAAREAGFKYIFTIKPGANGSTTDPTRLFRVNAGSPDISAKELKNLILKAANG